LALGRAEGQKKLRRLQWKQAEHNPTMAIFLGKQYLGQADKVETKNESSHTIEVPDDELKARLEGLRSGKGDGKS
jgi:hypothetical protein